ncbi:MAG TPA: Na+/H+ antiporter NhaA [Kofleriaceae bacterium]|nr:Na+/H+ antiporter NhaA [Kofleriaceae bacterium]
MIAWRRRVSSAHANTWARGRALAGPSQAERVVLAKAYTNQLDAGQIDPELNDVIGISTCDFELWPRKNGFDVPMHSRWRMQEQHSGTRKLSQLQLVFLELPKYQAAKQPVTLRSERLRVVTSSSRIVLSMRGWRLWSEFMASNESKNEARAASQRIVGLLARALARFLSIESASGVVLLVAAAIAVIWANSGWAGSYEHFWAGEWRIGISDAAVTVTPRFVVNEALMTLLFFVAGLELRRERAVGELSDRRRAALPVVAAIGGMIAPALVYLAIAGGAAARGWAVPTATDIALATGVLTLLGRRIPPSLRVFLLALAIIDDLGAIVVVAVFYSHDLAPLGLAVAALALGAIYALQRVAVARPLAYGVPAAAMWCGLWSAGIHPAIAGAVVGLVTPMRLAGQPADAWEESSPVMRLEAAVHPWVAFAIMPVFALANGGIVLGGFAGSPQVFAGVAFGLVAGKIAGVVSASAIAVKLGVGSLPRGAGWPEMVLVGAVAGIGFTMALFIADLAFVGRPDHHAAARLGLLVGSGAAVVVALACSALARRAQPASGAGRRPRSRAALG